jgi:hypothetical protein
MQELIVAHGSPHRFPPTANNPLGEFDASKIGTGEGAQAYGHGIYLAESPDVAGSYRTALSNPEVVLKTGERIANPVIGSPEDVAKAWLEEAYLANDKTPFDTAIARVSKLRKAANSQAQFDGAIKVLNEWKKSGATVDRGGALYTVDLPDEKIAQMLDYDLSFSQQSKRVKEALLKMYPSRIPKTLEYYKTDDLPMSQLLHHLGNDAVLAERLQKEGIPGIKYFDEGSRQSGKGTRNFVVFPGEEKHLKILERK